MQLKNTENNDEKKKCGAIEGEKFFVIRTLGTKIVRLGNGPRLATIIDFKFRYGNIIIATTNSTARKKVTSELSNCTIQTY